MYLRRRCATLTLLFSSCVSHNLVKPQRTTCLTAPLMSARTGQGKSDNKRQRQISMNKSDTAEAKDSAEQRGFKEMEAESAKRERKEWDGGRGARRQGRRMWEGHRRMEHTDISNSSPEKGGDTVLRIAVESCPWWLQHWWTVKAQLITQNTC